MKLVHLALMDRLLHLVQRGRRGGDWAGPQPTQAPSRCIVTAHPSTASVPVALLLYNGPLLCGLMCLVNDAINKCIGDDTKAAACQSPSCITKTKTKIKYGKKRFLIWRMELLHSAMW